MGLSGAPLSAAEPSSLAGAKTSIMPEGSFKSPAARDGVHEMGLEPIRPYSGQRILSPLRIPIPPLVRPSVKPTPRLTVADLRVAGN